MFILCLGVSLTETYRRLLSDNDPPGAMPGFLSSLCGRWKRAVDFPKGDDSRERMRLKGGRNHGREAISAPQTPQEWSRIQRSISLRNHAPEYHGRGRMSTSGSWGTSEGIPAERERLNHDVELRTAVYPIHRRRRSSANSLQFNAEASWLRCFTGPKEMPAPFVREWAA